MSISEALINLFLSTYGIHYLLSLELKQSFYSIVLFSSAFVWLKKKPEKGLPKKTELFGEVIATS